MKNKILFLFALLGCCIPALRAQIQNPCNSSACAATSVNVSTGFNQVSGTYVSPLALESNWTLTAVPSNASVTLPAPCYVITPNPAWSNFTNAKWVSPFQSNSYNINNPPGSGLGAFTFQNCFCVCQSTSVHLQFDVMADDEAQAFIDGTQVGVRAGTGSQFQYANRLVVDTFITLSPGTHCLTVNLYNTGSVAMGFAVEGTVTGASLLSAVCCNPTGSICGAKLQDVDCNGSVDPSVDPGLGGWTIVLKNASGATVGTAVTDAQGNYCFTNLAAGTYTVSEVAQSGWTQTYPSGAGTYTITLPAGGMAQANFGNCQQTTQPCDLKPDFKFDIHDCGVKFMPDFGAIPSGYDIVSVQWTFGDGYSSAELNPMHFYTATGTYKVCLTVTLFNGEQCCTRDVCRDLDVKACKGECDMDAEIKTTFDEKTCTYTFESLVNASGVPISSWYWDFGDGTHGTGSVVNHQFPAAGDYKVCVVLFANAQQGCCFKRICTDVSVKCSPCDRTTSAAARQAGTSLSDKDVIVLDQNVPNPFAESTTITYTIPGKFSKAQLLFTTTDGKLVKKVDISEGGRGSLRVFANDLSTGVYMYTLVVDGKAIDSKRMIKN